MAQRSRKRGQRAKVSRAAVATASEQAASAKRGPNPAPKLRTMSRSEERDAAVRAGLKPLEPGERPWALRIAVLLAVATGLGQFALFAFGVKLRVAGTHANAGPTIVFAMLMLGCAIGMWMLKYQALLGFMALLGITITAFAMALVTASSLVGFAIALAGVSAGGFLFYKLVRILSRIQMPKYPSR